MFNGSKLELLSNKSNQWTILHLDWSDGNTNNSSWGSISILGILNQKLANIWQKISGVIFHSVKASLTSCCMDPYPSYLKNWVVLQLTFEWKTSLLQAFWGCRQHNMAIKKKLDVQVIFFMAIEIMMHIYLFIWVLTSLSTLYRWYHDG